MKDNDIKPENGVYGSDVPDGLCYQWAADYFNDPDVKEDHEDEEEFVPQPYRGGSSTSGKKSASKSKAKNAGEKKDSAKTVTPAKKPADDSDGQLSLLGVA